MSRDMDYKSLDKNNRASNERLNKLLCQGNSRNRNRSKTKSDKFTFLTINNIKCNGFKFDCDSLRT